MLDGRNDLRPIPPSFRPRLHLKTCNSTRETGQVSRFEIMMNRKNCVWNNSMIWIVSVSDFAENLLRKYAIYRLFIVFKKSKVLSFKQLYDLELGRR